MDNLVNELKEKMLSKSYKALCNVAGNILLRPNDDIKLMGEERCKARKIAFEQILQEKYLNDKLYQYYTTYDNKKHGFCTYERWLSLYSQSK
ncbi:hypothetical protein [uncultured Clostridium sp.]|uniref:hypothetical protein n=1 Tax=uncultured Clostridium sp. TaxID=59620 RepID=UPI003216D210